jgi:hypothetical protein
MMCGDLTTWLGLGAFAYAMTVMFQDKDDKPKPKPPEQKARRQRMDNAEEAREQMRINRRKAGSTID